MKKLTLEKIEKAKTEILNSLSLPENQDFIQMVETKYNTFNKSIDIEKIDYCINRYIDAELDFRAEGMRGIGRATTFIPRLGAYFRKQLSKMDKEEIDIFYNLIQNLMLRCYLVGALMLKEEIEKPTITKAEDLFEAWIPKIYVTPLGVLGPRLQETLTVSSATALEQIENFMNKHEMKGGGLFSSDKTKGILSYYLVAGCGLRIEETGGL